MKGKRYTEEQSIGILKEHEAGLSVGEIIRKHGIANGIFYRWKSRFGGMEVKMVPGAGIEPARCCHRGIFLPTTACAAAPN